MSTSEDDFQFAVDYKIDLHGLPLPPSSVSSKDSLQKVPFLDRLTGGKFTSTDRFPFLQLNTTTSDLIADVLEQPVDFKRLSQDLRDDPILMDMIQKCSSVGTQ